MKTDERRKNIASELAGAGDPVTGGDLAARFGVSRQVIVQDMAVLRAEGLPVVATPRGYMLLRAEGTGRLVKTVVTRHRDYEAMEEELLIMVGCGAKVVNARSILSTAITGNRTLTPATWHAQESTGAVRETSSLTGRPSHTLK